MEIVCQASIILQSNKSKDYLNSANDSKKEKSGLRNLTVQNYPKSYLKNWRTFRTELKTKLKKFAKDAAKYEGGRWTKSGTVNKIFISELRKYSVDAAQTMAAIHKGANRLRTTARSATEIYGGFRYIIEEDGQEEEIC